MNTDPIPAAIPKLREQLLQLRQLHEDGALSADALRQAWQPLAQQLVEAVLADTPAPGAPPQVRPEAAPARPVRRPSGIAVAALAGAVALAVAGYTFTGRPAAIGVAPAGWVADAGAPAAAAPHDLGTDAIDAMVGQLAARLKAAPADAEGWAMLGRSYTTLGRHDEALQALREAQKQRPDDAAILADLADALAMQQGRSLEGEPTRLVQQALARDPDQLKALVLAGTAAFDRGDHASAERHWQRAVAAGPADSRLVQMARDGVDELRTLAAAPGARDRSTPQQSVPAAPNARISGTVRLAEGVRATQPPDATVFVFARAADAAAGMPLALLRRQVKDLPFTFTLDDSMAMSPAARLSGAQRVVVSARISASGQAQPQPGDLVGRSAPVAPGAQGLLVEIGAADAAAR